MRAMNRKFRTSLVATVLLGTITLSYAAKASFVFIPDGDTASLVDLLVTSMQQLNTLNQQLGTVRQTYSETKKLVGFAEDAVGAGLRAPTSLARCSCSRTRCQTCASSTARRTTSTHGRKAGAS